MARRRATVAPPTIEQLATSKDVLVCTGSGGVGKTTTAAAIAAVTAVNEDAKVLVLTVDPARRLASAMGLEQFGNKATQVPDELLRAGGTEPRGQLWAAMLDTKQGWDDLVRRHAPDAATRDAILANPLYQNITGKFVQSHDYVAMERLYELHTSGRYDLVVVDTPPTRNAIDFLDAPQRMAEFFSSRLLRWLIAPYRSRVVGMASKPFYSVADRILGSQFLGDIAEFFILFQSMYDGFVERARAVETLLRSPATSFVVVSTLESAPAREAEYFMRLLVDRELHLGALVLNKVLPAYLTERSATASARRLGEDPAEAVSVLEAVVTDGVEHLPRVVSVLAGNFANYRQVATREAEQRTEMADAPALVCSVPYYDHDITDVGGLLELGSRLWA